MPRPGTHTTKRSAIELAVITYLRRRTSGATSEQIHSAAGSGRTLNATMVLLKKLTDEGYVARTFEYEYDTAVHQRVGAYRYTVAA